jgi:hypothetical protein
MASHLVAMYSMIQQGWLILLATPASVISTTLIGALHDPQQYCAPEGKEGIRLQANFEP